MSDPKDSLTRSVKSETTLNAEVGTPNNEVAIIVGL